MEMKTVTSLAFVLISKVVAAADAIPGPVPGSPYDFAGQDIWVNDQV